MNLQEIEKLIEKFFEGETSLEEETLLREFFSGTDVPHKWAGLTAYFAFSSHEKETAMSTDPLARIPEMQTGKKRWSAVTDLKRPYIYWISGVAAGLLILVAVLVKFDPFTRTIDSTYQDPQTAYLEAKKILFYVSNKLNKGTSRLQPVGKFETGLQNLKTVGSFDQSVGEISRLEQVEKASQMIIRN
jgi:hypothetical protein